MAITWDGNTATAPSAPANGSEASVDTTGVTVTLGSDTQACVLTLDAAGYYKRGVIGGTGTWVYVPALTPKAIYGLDGVGSISVKAASGTVTYYVETLSPANTRGGR